MANSLKYTWHVYCETEGLYVNVNQKSKPTLCPNNNSHTVDLVKTNFEVFLQEDSVLLNPLGVGQYLSKGVAFTADPSTTTVFDYAFPHEITIIFSRLFCEDINKGDILSIDIAPDLVVGAVTLPASIGDTVINVNNTVIEHCVKGATLRFGSETTSYLIKNIDLHNSQVVLTVPLTENITPGSFVKRTVTIVDNMTLPSKNIIYFGKNDLRKVILPPGIIFRFTYVNNTAESKQVNFVLDCY